MGSSKCHLDAAFFSSALGDADPKWFSWSCGWLCKAHAFLHSILNLMISHTILTYIENNVFSKGDEYNFFLCCRWAK